MTYFGPALAWGFDVIFCSILREEISGPAWQELLGQLSYPHFKDKETEIQGGLYTMSKINKKVND